MICLHIFVCVRYRRKINLSKDGKKCIYTRTKHTLTRIYVLYKVDDLQKELTDHVDDSKIQFGGVNKEIQIIRSNIVTEVGECRRSSDGLDRRLSKLEGLCGRFDSVSDSLERIKEGLNRHVSGLWSCVNGLNVTVTSQGDLIHDIQTVQLENVHSDIRSLNSSIVDLATEFYSFTEGDFMGEWLGNECTGFDFWTRDSPLRRRQGQGEGKK